MRQAENTYSRALGRAAEMSGGVEKLAVKLQVSRLILRAWINGTQEVPIPVFLKVVDLIMDDKLAEFQTKPPKRSERFSGEQSA